MVGMFDQIIFCLSEVCDNQWQRVAIEYSVCLIFLQLGQAEAGSGQAAGVIVNTFYKHQRCLKNKFMSASVSLL